MAGKVPGGPAPAIGREYGGIESEEPVRFETWSAIMPAGGGYEVVPRVIRTDFVTRWERQADEARQQAEQLRAQVMATIQEQRPHE